MIDKKAKGFAVTVEQVGAVFEHMKENGVDIRLASRSHLVEFEPDADGINGTLHVAPAFSKQVAAAIKALKIG